MAIAEKRPNSSPEIKMYVLAKSTKYNKTFTKQKRSRFNFFFGKKDIPQNSNTARKIAAIKNTNLTIEELPELIYQTKDRKLGRTFNQGDLWILVR